MGSDSSIDGRDVWISKGYIDATQNITPTRQCFVVTLDTGKRVLMVDIDDVPLEDIFGIELLKCKGVHRYD